MTTLEKIRLIAQSANTKQVILPDSMVDAVMSKIIDAIDEQCKRIGYDGVTYHRPANEYDNVFYGLLYATVIRQIVFDYLEKEHPHAWFKPMYFTNDKYKEFENMSESELKELHNDVKSNKNQTDEKV